MKYSITVDDNEVVTDQEFTSYTIDKEQTGNWWNYQYYITGISSFTIENVSISGEGIDDTTEVSITITITTDYGSQIVTYSKTINELGLQKQ